MNRGSNPRRNRVTPYGIFEAVPARGNVMGNRGCIHDAAGDIGSRPFARRAWLICQLEFRGRRHEISPGTYTPLFALDEATMLAAGHRPCSLCRRGAFSAFRAAWCRAHGFSAISADDMDRELHAARIDSAGRQITRQTRFGELPDGAMIGTPVGAAMVWGGLLYPWRHSGYGDRETVEPGRIVTVLTPSPTVRILASGYRPAIALCRPPAAISRREVAEYPAGAERAP